MDPGTGLTILGSAIGSAKLVEKLLGPTSDYLGEGLKNYTEKAHKNLGRIFRRSVEILGDRINEPAQVSPKVLSRVVREGVFTENRLAAEYFGGIMAASRTPNKDDDRGAYYLDIVSRLSSFQIRAHYLLYAAIKQTYNGADVDLALGDRRSTYCRTFVPADELAKGMGLDDRVNLECLLHHIFDGLSKECIIESDWHYGDLRYKLPHEHPLLKQYGNLYVPREEDWLVYGQGLSFFPAGLGVELFTWAHGRSDVNVSDFLKESIVFFWNDDVHIPQFCKHVPIAMTMDLPSND